VTDFRWTAQREQAAQLVADDSLSDESIASRVGVSRQTLAVWKRKPAFQQRVTEHLDAAREAIKAEGIANRINRVNALNDRWERMQTVIAERAADTSSGTYTTAPTEDGETERIVAPGWSTGLLVRTEKQIGAGDKAIHVIEFAVDTGLLRELRAHEEQAAKELGQWTEKRDVTSDGQPLKAYIAVDVERV